MTRKNYIFFILAITCGALAYWGYDVIVSISLTEASSLQQEFRAHLKFGVFIFCVASIASFVLFIQAWNEK